MHKADNGPTLGTRYIDAAQHRRAKDLPMIRLEKLWGSNTI